MINELDNNLHHESLPKSSGLHSTCFLLQFEGVRIASHPGRTVLRELVTGPERILAS